MLKSVPPRLLRCVEFQVTASRLPVVNICRHASYYKSNVEESPDKYTQYEKSFKEWKFVENLFPPTHVPDPPTEEMPSGWKPPSTRMDVPYIIRRTKNHLMPIYIQIERRGQVRYTLITKVEGDIWQCEKDIGEYLQARRSPMKVIVTHTDEIRRRVVVKGDHVDEVKEWASAKGF